MMIAVGNGRTTSAEAEEFALGAFLHLLVLAIEVLLFAMKNVVEWCSYFIRTISEQTANGRIKPAASHHLASRENRHVAVGTVAAVINGVFVQAIRNAIKTLFIEVKRPEVILEIEGCLAVLVLLITLPEGIEQGTIFKRLDVGAFADGFLLGGRAISTEGKNIDLMLNDKVNDGRNLVDVRSAYGGHHSTMNTGFANHTDGTEGGIERPWLADHVVRLAKAIDAELILAAT